MLDAFETSDNVELVSLEWQRKVHICADVIWFVLMDISRHNLMAESTQFLGELAMTGWDVQDSLTWPHSLKRCGNLVHVASIAACNHEYAP